MDGQDSSSGGGRRSPGATERSRAGRSLNDLFRKEQTTGKRLGLNERQAQRRKTLIEALARGVDSKGRPLPALQRLQHMQELLELGETPARLRKRGVLIPSRPVPQIAEQPDLVARVQATHGFDPRVWTIFGVTLPGGAPDTEPEGST